ncbi:MAG: hypothetical protein ACXU8N_21675 [Telluria sp.]
MNFDLGGLLQQYAGGQQNVNPQQAEYDFERIADQAPTEQLASGVTEALRSDQTPPFPNMVSNLFGNSNPNQRAGMLNQLLGSVGPGLLSSLAGGVLGNLMRNHSMQQQGAQTVPQITPEVAAQVPPQEVQQIAQHAEQQNPGVVDQMGRFYAQHPTLVKSLGGAALAIALGHMAQGMRRQ